MSLIQQIAQRHALANLRRIRIFHFIYNLLKRKHLLYLREKYKALGMSKWAISGVSSDDFLGMESKPYWLEENDSKKVLPEHPRFVMLRQSHQQALLDWSEEGYAHLEGFFSEDEIDFVAEINDSLWASNKGKWRNGDRRVRMAFEIPELWGFANQYKLRRVTSLLLGEEAELMNTINFRKGDEQPIHSDSFYMTTFPLGGLVGVWIALEDIHPDAAPLRYYPGSHKLPYIFNERLNNRGNFWRIGKNGEREYEDQVRSMIEKYQMEEVVFLPKKGDVLLWHANLLHGGSPRNNDELSRKSMVCHFVAKNAICYHEFSQRPAFKIRKRC